MRFSNVLGIPTGDPALPYLRFDVEVAIKEGSTYSVFDSSANTFEATGGIGKRFAGVPTEPDSGIVGAGIQVGTEVDFQLSTKASCCVYANCYKVSLSRPVLFDPQRLVTSAYNRCCPSDGGCDVP